MARINIWETIVNGSGLPITGASVDVYNARTVVHSTVYAAESGGGTLSNPVTTTNGTVPGWVDEGEYDLHVTGVGITTTDKRFNAVLGGNPAKLPDSITATEIAASAVGSSEIAAGAVTSGKLAADSVIDTKIAAGAISQSSDFAAQVVDTAALANLGVTSGKLAASAVIAGKVAAGAVDSSGIFAAGVVNATALGADAVTTAKIQNLAVTDAKIANDTILATSIAAGAVGTSELAASAVVLSKIANQAVSSDKMNLTILEDKLGAAANVPASDTTLCSVAIPGGEGGDYLALGHVSFFTGGGAPGNDLTVKLFPNTDTLDSTKIVGDQRISSTVFDIITVAGGGTIGLQAAKVTGGGSVTDIQAKGGNSTYLLAIKLRL